jgi:hypothetical protein
MGKIVLLAVAAAWAAVLLPPLLRSRLENRPGSSVTDFRRQLSTLQRTVPTRSITPMRSMARPLASSPLQRPAVTGRLGPVQSSHLQRSHGVPAQDMGYTGELQRREHTTGHHRPMPARRISHREIIRRRRLNVLFVLVMATGLTLFLAATTKSSAMVYAFAFSFVSLCGYCYKLAQLRQFDQDRYYSDAHWFNAA